MSQVLSTADLHTAATHLLADGWGKQFSWWVGPMGRMAGTLDLLSEAGHHQLDAEQARATLDFIGVLAKS